MVECSRDGDIGMSLEQLRALLHAPFDLEHDFEAALTATALRAREALGASRALVAVPEGGGWRAYVDTGEVLEAAVVGLVASTAVIRQAFEQGPALETVTLKAVRRSGSLDRQRIHSVLAVPLARVVGGAEAGARPIGVLYLDRRDERPAFTTEDRDWALDFAALTGRTLTLVELLAQARRQRDAARLEAADLRGQQGFGAVDVLESRDPAFRQLIGRTLTGVMRAPKLTVLLVGPTGSGKSHLARRLHAIGPRREQPFVTLDCGQATSSEALSAELFGFAKKSGFAVDAGGRPGKALLADGGVLFIDEVNSMPLDLQPRLLRLVEAGRYSALGTGEEIRVDVQIIAAANEDLRVAVRERRFREDLYFRLSQLTLTLPALSQRRADVVPLAERMLAQIARDQGLPLPHFSAEALALLEGFAWERAGNLRGLLHTVERTLLMLPSGQTRIERDDLVLSEPLSDLMPVAVPDTVGGFRRLAPAALKALLTEKIRTHRGVIARISQDAELIEQFGVGERVIPASTLRQRIARLGLNELLDEVRAAQEFTLDEALTALRSHGNGSDAARALGVTRDRLVWRLRQAGLTVGRVLGRDDDAGES